MIEKGRWEGEIWNRRKNGEVFPQWLTVKSVSNNDGQFHYIAVASDMTRRKKAEERIRFLAYYDGLTGLANRTHIEEKLQDLLKQATRSNLKFAVIFIDLDRFKIINDSLGHIVGDILLQKIATRMKAEIRDIDSVGRLGGDEFMIILPHTNCDEAAVIAQRIYNNMKEPINVNGNELVVRLSIGIAMFPDDGNNTESLMKNADTAMYVCKSEKQSSHQFFTKDMNIRTKRRLQIENDLVKALKNDELFLNFQPQVNASDGRITGFEALLRWQHPVEGLLMPDRFIPIAEESPIMIEVDQWVLKRVCSWIRHWQSEIDHLVPVAVNISGTHFGIPQFAQSIRRLVEQSGIDMSLIEIELTETSLVKDIKKAMFELKILKSLGFRLAMDDFGTGYSNMSYLQQLPMDKLKIDYSFVSDLVTSTANQAIVQAIIMMADGFGFNVIAEGVETYEEAELLKKYGCDEFQGFLFSKPIPAQDVPGLLKQGVIEMMVKIG